MRGRVNIDTECGDLWELDNVQISDVQMDTALIHSDKAIRHANFKTF